MNRVAVQPDAHFVNRYGPWGLVAGASQGLGAAYARELARRGLSVVLIARRSEPLQALGREIERDFGVAARPVTVDLSSPDFLSVIERETRDLAVGLLVYNAAFSNGGLFLDRSPESLLKVIDTDCRAPLLLTRHFAGQMRERHRGGIILMSSLTAFNGSPGLAAYGATKGFNLVLGEGLWYELRRAGIDLTVCCAGAVRTPGYEASVAAKSSFPPVLEPAKVAREAVRALGRRMIVIPGSFNRAVSFLMRRLLPRRTTVRIMGEAVDSLSLSQR